MDEQSIFVAALERDAAARREYLDEACAGNPELRRRVEKLLAAHENAASFLDQPAGELTATAVHPITEKPGTVIGPYKLLQQIGEGGMGVVYMAEQTEPVERRVALKIIKPGMDTRQVIGRFEAERQALAMMDHPNIAKVLDAGTTDSGRPYFVMELVKGIPITEYCDRQHLTPKERLDLFIPICHAVQHAHQKGIIHRDIKPTNVLIAEYDDWAASKIIDFGVAKAIDQRLTEKTIFTQLGQVVGTVDYMSPEQAKLNQLDIDTRSDIYSLGVLLYELLTGETPFDRERLRSAAFDELLRIIREEEPPRPSIRLSTSDTLPSIAANRQIEPKKLSTLIRGELDWIVMKALEKDRARRYETATSLSADIERYLSDEPVQACPPSTAYRLRKLARRHKTVLATVVLVAVSLIVGTGIATWQAIRATRESRRAVAAEELASEQAKRANEESERAKTEAAIARAVNDFINEDLLAQADPRHEPDRDVKLRTVLDRAAAGIEGRFKDQPLVEAAIRNTLGVTYHQLGEDEEARRQHERALEIRRRELGPEHPDTLESTTNLSAVLNSQGHYGQSENLSRDVLDIRRRVLGPEHPETAKAMGNLARDLWYQGRFSESEAIDREVLEILKRTLGPEHPDTLWAMMNLALSLSNQGRHGESEELEREALEIQRRVLGSEHPRTLKTMHNLATLLSTRGDLVDAEELHREVVELQSRVLGPEHPSTLLSLDSLGVTTARQGRLAEAEELLQAVLEARKLTLGPEHPHTLRTKHKLADTIGRQGRFAGAIELCGEVSEIQRRVLGPSHPHTVRTLYDLAKMLERHGDLDASIESYRDVLEIDPNMIHAYRGLGYAHERAGELDAAAVAYRKAIELDAVNPAPAGTWQYSTVATAYNNLARVAQAKGGHEAVIETFSELIEGRTASHHAFRCRGTAYAALERFPEAIKDLRAAVEMCRQSLGEEENSTASREWLGTTSLELGKALSHGGQRDEAESAYREGVEVWQELAEESHGSQTYRNRLAELLRRLGYLLSNTGRCAEALNCFDRALELTPNNPASHSRLAFFRLHAPDESFRDAAKALTHAARAVELKPLVRDYRLLAEAAHRTGDWQRMAEALEKTLEFGTPVDSPTCFQLAIAHGHLDDREKATEWLAKGVALMEGQESDDPASAALRAQAEEVLGLNAIQTTEN